ncbi:dienelactone hydrolase family protein [Candidatus Neomarinimicrobiota bacterium]
MRNNDKDYYYSIAIPHDYNGSESYPLMLTLHWGEEVHFQSGISFLNTFILPTLQGFNGIIISPSCSENSGWIHENSEIFILSLIDQIKTDYNIDSLKIVITGYSMGGIGTWYYAVTYPEIFSLAIPIASMPPNSILPITDIIPTYVIHGDNDEYFPLSNAKNLVSDIKIKNNIIKLVEVENATHYDTDKYKEPLSESLDWIEGRWEN